MMADATARTRFTGLAPGVATGRTTTTGGARPPRGAPSRAGGARSPSVPAGPGGCRCGCTSRPACAAVDDGQVADVLVEHQPEGDEQRVVGCGGHDVGGGDRRQRLACRGPGLEEVFAGDDPDAVAPVVDERVGAVLAVPRGVPVASPIGVVGLKVSTSAVMTSRTTTLREDVDLVVATAPAGPAATASRS